MTLGISFFAGSLIASIWMKRYEILPYTGIFSIVVIVADILMR